MVEALIDGERRPIMLAELARGDALEDRGFGTGAGGAL
jgi:hypothetical protein